jgi:urease beta subunit
MLFDILCRAAGTAVRFEPGERKVVCLVDIAGNRVIRGLLLWINVIIWLIVVILF